ncbi:SHOCT domain-containing protein [Plantibacter sp. YIM 135249]|uniref:SHOCT domain-containing protein n=1 Tax=Plantibacter sp. YIM 135249 TaxID=3423918 RepID=UPI003D347B06
MLLRRFGRPGLLGLAARTAVVAGTAAATAGAINRHAQNRAVEQSEAAAYEQDQSTQYAEATAPQPVAAAAPTAAGGSGGATMVDEIQRLATLHQQGALTDAEFEAAKQRLLG